jgi:hypothetical protein
LRPPLREKRGTQDNEGEAALGQSLVDLAAQAVTEQNLELVEPHAKATALQPLGKRPHDRFFVLAGMADEEVVVHRHRWSQLDSGWRQPDEGGR